MPHPVHPATTGDRIRAVQLSHELELLGATVTLVHPVFDDAPAPGCVTVRGRPPGVARLVWRAWLVGARARDPYAVHTWPLLRRSLRDGVIGTRPDVVDFQHSFTWLPQPCPTVVTLIDVNSDRLARAPAAVGRRRLARVIEMERRALAGADAAVVLSPEDEARARALAPQAAVVHRVPLGYRPSAVGSSRRLGPLRVGAYVGSFGYPPNRQAVDDLRRLWPQVREASGLERLVVVGRDAARHVRPERWLEVRSDVVDVAAALTDVDVLLVPLSHGGGVRVKIIEAMALGLPVVSTRIGIEGLGAVDGRHAAIAEELAQFPDACARLRSPSVRSAMANAAHELWEAHHSPASMARSMAAVYEQAIDRRRALATGAGVHGARARAG